MAVDSLKQKKLRITSKAIASQVLVVQDGAAADGTATIKIDNGFRDGYTSALVSANSMKRVIFDVEEMECSRTGRSLTFSVQDYMNRNTFGLGPGDTVEFWAEIEEPDAPINGAFPAWHSAEQAAGQTLLFFGFISEVQRQERSGGINRFRIKAVDAIAAADVIKLQQSKPNNVTIPKIIFNCDRTDDADFFYAIKNYDAAESDPTLRYGYGWPKDIAQAKLTLEDVFLYLQSAYQSELYDRDFLAGASDDLFDATDLEKFDGILPPKTILEATGFGQSVRQILQANAPDFDVFVDPRTRQWRFLPTAKDMVPGGYATIASVVTTKKKWVVDSIARFATSGTGSTVRLQSQTDPRASEIATVSVLNSGAVTIEIDTTSNYAFVAGDIIVPMHAAADRPPLVSIDLEADCAENTLEVDLRGVYTAVSIVSFKQATSKVQISQTASSNLAAALVKAYDTAYETNFRPSDHQNRRTDRGADGNGIVIREIETWGSGADAITRVYFSETSSAYENDHQVSNESRGDAEWTGTAFHLLTVTAGSVNVEANRVSAIITHFSRAGWVDAGMTIRKFRIDLDRDLIALAPTVKGELTHSTTGDRFEMSSSDIYAPTSYNKRSIVDRSWKVSSTTVDDEARYLDSNGCPEAAEFRGINGQHQSLPAVPAERKVENATQEQVFNRIGGALIAAPQRILWLKPKDPPETFEQLCAKLPKPVFTPRPFTLTMNRVTHEVLQARSPETGFAGTAWLWHKHAEELQIVSERFEHESQRTQFETIAESIRARHSEPHYSGDLVLNGITKWLGYTDLGFRVNFGAGYTGIVNGVVTEQARFYGLVQTLKFSFKSGTATMNFSSSGISETLTQQVFERQFVSQTSAMRELQERIARAEKSVDCLATRDTPKPTQPVDGCNVTHQGQSISRKVTVINPKQTAIGTGETALGGPVISGGGVSGNPASIGGTHKYDGALIVERDFLGKPFGVINPSGALLGGTESGDRFVPSFVDPATPVALPQYLADSLQELASAILGIDLVTPVSSTLIEVGEGSTTTVIQLTNAIEDDDRYVGGFIEFRHSSIARPKYTIASHTAHSITLTGAMSEAAPSNGAAATVWAARIPTLNPTDFPLGGRPFKDASGTWFVATRGQLVPATLGGTTLSRTAGTTAPDLRIVTKKDYETRLIDWEETKFFYEGRSADAATGTVANVNPSYGSTTYDAEFAFYGWSDGSKRGNLVMIKVPRDIDVNSPITLKLYAELSGAVSAGQTAVVNASFRAQAEFEERTAGAQSIKKVTIEIHDEGYTSLDRITFDFGTLYAAGTVEPDDWIHGVIYRDTPADAADDYSGTVRGIYATFSGKRRLGGADNDGNQIGGADGEDTARLFLMAG